MVDDQLFDARPARVLKCLPTALSFSPEMALLNAAPSGGLGTSMLQPQQVCGGWVALALRGRVGNHHTSQPRPSDHDTRESRCAHPLADPAPLTTPFGTVETSHPTLA